jgi:hypothetical protein
MDPKDRNDRNDRYVHKNPTDRSDRNKRDRNDHQGYEYSTKFITCPGGLPAPACCKVELCFNSVALNG